MSKPKLDDSEVFIRHFQKDDEKQVKDVFANGIMSLVGDAFRKQLFFPPNTAIIAGFGGAVALRSRSIMLTLATEFGLLAALYAWTRSLFADYCQYSIKSDLSDIETVYINSGGCFLVATDSDGRIVGTVAGQPKGDQLYELRRMSVDKSMQGRGLGKRLVKHLEKECKTGRMILETTSVQYAAHALYSKQGYQLTKRVSLQPKLPFKYFSNLELYTFEKDF